MANRPAARTVSGVSPRLYPVGKAVILLAVCAPELAGRRLTIEGRRVQAIRVGRLTLLVAYVAPRDYTPEEIEGRRTDPVWFGAEARLLEQAVERATVHGRVVPMPLLTVFAQPGDLEGCALERAARWTRTLARLSTKRECAVHLYAGPHTPPGGVPYVARIAARATRNGRAPPFSANAAVTAHALSVWRESTALAVASRGVPAEDRHGALWSAVMLLEERDIVALSALLERSAVAGAPLGITAYVEAPRAPFTFA
ncbi:MAG: GvpL/GvpF family gas vesicle protein [Candidatus Eremiobacteraeota bacterium]|nr:GvpL/GvpF family gas vesicle protein [Candidatus Eremiobacteraeota bacterium]